MGYFNNPIHDDFKPDFGFNPPHRTKTKCANPAFADHYLHRIAVMKEVHVGAKGDFDEGGSPGWISKLVCTGCGKEFRGGYFHPDKKL